MFSMRKKKKTKDKMIKVQSFPALRMALVGESRDEAATPLSFPHINQDEANQAKFNRKEP